MITIIIDTNVLVSALLKPDSIPTIILSLVLNNKVKLGLSKEIIEEYQEVLLRPKFGKISIESKIRLLDNLKNSLIKTNAENRIEVLDDPDDNKFLQLALELKADYLITGDKKHFKIKNFFKTKIVSPREFINDVFYDLIDL